MWYMNKMLIKGLGASTALTMFHVQLLQTGIISNTDAVVSGISFFEHGTF